MLLLPSYSENFGMVVLEAMAIGCPVIVTAEVGLATAVNTSGAGLVADGDPQSLGTAIISLEDDEPRRKEMADAGRKIAAEQFSWVSVAAEMEKLYTECVEDRRRALTG
jgi:glycosyltransferase involved in cell wall biosynthesis